MMTVCNSGKVKLGKVSGREVITEFIGGHVTSDAGVLLLSEADDILRLLERTAKAIPDEHDQARVEYSQFSILRQRVLGLALGYEDAIDHDSLCYDFAFQTATRCVEKLAGASTVGRLEHRAGSRPN